MTATQWTMPAPPEVDGPTIGADRPMLSGYLAWQRFTLLNICAGLDADQLAQRPSPPSTLSLLGLVRHLAKVERIWFVERFGAQELEPMYPGAKDADFDDAVAAGAQVDLERYLEQTAYAEELIAKVDLDATIDHRGTPLSLRFVYLHLIHEYARHNGHADILRQAIDGVTGR